ncbi:putative HflK protein [Magnetofaba australis IT-1]|uniref:Protein HflK n=1 Tax=Magnetofaba australis IT-1 TaxID=1434232 RepID=A0A1Y2K585_9PROT|nr:putative HflK protein [Magnetofaba australis IT-1]
MEKIIEMARARLSNSNIPSGGKQLWMVLAGVALAIWMATGIYVVGPEEQGVVIRFGKYVETTESGPHWHLPFPIESVYKPKVSQVQRIEIGYRSRGRNNIDVPAESLMLTGDENIIDIDLSVQYRIDHENSQSVGMEGNMGGAANYLFNVRNPGKDPHQVVRNAAETAVREVIGTNKIDVALTTGKDRIQTQTHQKMQEILDGYLSGVKVVTVQLQQVQPPEEVIHAFKDVASAREDRERAINEAQGYSNDILPKAKGEAAKMVQEAEAYKASKVARATGDAQRFESLYTEYQKAKDVTRTRLYLETMETVMGNANKVIIEPKAGGNGVLPYLPLDRRMYAPTANQR